MEETKSKKITVENILCLFIILCPILDIISFLFRNWFSTTISPSTILRPIIPILIILYLFYKEKAKGKLILIGIIYALFAGIHLWIFSTLKTTLSFGGISLELQHIVNYTFMIITLIIYAFVFTNQTEMKLRKSVLIAAGIAIGSILLSILTNTSSPTYIEGIGKKGWFESGNSLGAMLTLMLFILLPLIHEKKYRYFTLGIGILISVFLIFIIGTRVGLLGCIGVIFLFTLAEITTAIFQKVQLNKYIVIGGISGIVIIIAIVIMVGTTTFQRREYLKEIETDIIDEQTQETSHISLSLLELRNKIQKGEMTEEELSKPAQQSILDLYQYANEKQLINNDMRSQQLIYNLFQIKNQANPLLLLFGNGYVTNFRELVLEMEIVAFLLNYGIFGFILYFVPFLAIAIIGLIKGIRHYKKIDNSYVMTLLGCFFSYGLAMVSGYVFFNVTTMLMIVILHILLLKKAKELEQSKKEVRDI